MKNNSLGTLLTKIILIVVFIGWFIWANIYYMFILPNKVETANNKIIQTFTKTILPTYKHTILFNYNNITSYSNRLQYKYIPDINNLLGKYGVKNSYTNINAGLSNLCNDIYNPCMVALRKLNKVYIAYPLLKVKIPYVIEMSNKEVVCSIDIDYLKNTKWKLRYDNNHIKCIVYNQDTWYYRPILAGSWDDLDSENNINLINLLK